MPDLVVRLDTAAYLKLSTQARRQIPFAASRALNDVALAFQEAERGRMRHTFTLRRPDFLEKQGVKIKQFARKDAPVVVVGVDEKADFLVKFEAGGVKRAQSGGSLALPTDIRRTKRDIITRANRPRSLLASHRLSLFVVRAGSTDPRTRHLSPGIYQRLGRGGRAAVRVLYAFEPAGRIPATLHFGDTASSVLNREWARAFERRFAEALATAR